MSLLLLLNPKNFGPIPPPQFDFEDTGKRIKKKQVRKHDLWGNEVDLLDLEDEELMLLLMDRPRR